MTLAEAILWCVAAQLAVAASSLPLRGFARASPIVYGASLCVCLGALAAAGAGLVGAQSAVSALTLPIGLPWLGAHFRTDALAVFFLIVVNLGGAAASLFALGYGRHEGAPHRVLPFYPVYLAAMNLVVLAADAYTFLASWEFMSLASWALVMAHHREAGNARAAFIYLVMASLGTLALLLAFGLLAGADGQYEFAAIRTSVHAPWVGALALVLALLGTGSKAGLVPLHIWLPLAHPAAPSHVSALMSGVMTKVAIYGFVRVAFDLVGAVDWWFGLLVLIVGAVTAGLGVLQAVMQTNLKRLLAYSTVENIGIIFIGLGLALAFQANGMGLAAALALTAALFHCFNHALFKSLLFFGAGAVLTATGERDVERLGGLIHPMPWTSFAFLAGCVAICALPPLNGFVSEWLTFQAVLQSPQLPQWGLKIMVPVGGGMLALSAALAAACFVRAFGVTFLGRPRTKAAEQACEVDRFSLAAMFLLVALCFLAGILPGFVIDALSSVSRDLVGARMPMQASLQWLTIQPIAQAGSSYNGLLVFLFIAASAILGALFIHQFASRARRSAPAWDCGFPDPRPITQYTAASFAQPIRRVFGTLALRAREEVEIPPPGATTPARLRVELRDLAWDFLYAPVVRTVGATAEWLNRFQFLTIRRYLGLVFIALVALLVVLAL
jgi:formate hydrogenlyase subunit 3/multisubunit Na+/H+ antiporter MnhD subunit